MNTKTTWGLSIAAVVMLLYIIIVEHGYFGAKRNKIVPSILPGFDPALVESLQVTVTNQTFEALKAGDGWKLSKPNYPAQTTPIQSLLLKMGEMRKLDVIPPKEVQAQGGLKAFGLEPPRATLKVTGSAEPSTLLIGKTTALTNQIYLQVAGSSDVIVTDGALLSYIPTSPAIWRSPMLLQFENLTFDAIFIKTGARVVEIEFDPTNKLWHITKPMPARADQDRIAVLLQKLRTARISGFIGDAVGMDLDKFGLQAPEVALSFLRGTNQLASVEFGASPTNHPSLVVARKVAENALVMADKELSDSLKQPYKTFHESRLLSFKAKDIDHIEVKAFESFSLSRQNNRWNIKGAFEGQADPPLMQDFLTNLAALEIVEFAKDVPTDQDLKNYFLAPPLVSYGLFNIRTNEAGLLTNSLIATIEFGTNQLDSIYVRRSDEAPVYHTRYADMLLLPKRAFEFRHRRLWGIDQTNVMALQLIAQGNTNRLARDASLNWSNDQIINASVTENIFRLSNAEVIGWVSKGKARLRLYGINENSPKLVIEAVLGGKPEAFEMSIGNPTPSGNYFCSAMIPGISEPVVLEFPGALLKGTVQMFAPAQP